MGYTEKSIQEIENIYWPDKKEYISTLEENCHQFRKIKIKDLQIHQIIELLIQDIGSEILFPIVLDRMDKNILEEDDYDGSSFLESIDFFSDKIFKRNPKLHKATLDLLTNRQSEIEGQIGWKRYERIVREIEVKSQHTTKK